jgi:hypothetical protein
MATLYSGRVQLRRDTAANFASDDPTLLEGELAWETDTNLLKVGDGTNSWNALDYVSGSGGGGGGRDTGDIFASIKDTVTGAFQVPGW